MYFKLFFMQSSMIYIQFTLSLKEDSSTIIRYLHRDTFCMFDKKSVNQTA